MSNQMLDTNDRGYFIQSNLSPTKKAPTIGKGLFLLSNGGSVPQYVATPNARLRLVCDRVGAYCLYVVETNEGFIEIGGGGAVGKSVDITVNLPVFVEAVGMRSDDWAPLIGEIVKGWRAQ